MRILPPRFLNEQVHRLNRADGGGGSGRVRGHGAPDRGFVSVSRELTEAVAHSARWERPPPLRGRQRSLAAHIGDERVREEDGAVQLLVGLQQGDDETRKR